MMLVSGNSIFLYSIYLIIIVTDTRIFKIIREALGWTRYKMAKELGISQVRYQKLECKTVAYNKFLLKRLFEISGLDADTFMRIL